MNEPYDRLADDFHGYRPHPGIEALIVLQHPDGTRTEGARLHDAAVIWETATDIEPVTWDSQFRTVPRDTLYQFRLTTRTLTVYTPEYFRRGNAPALPPAQKDSTTR